MSNHSAAQEAKAMAPQRNWRLLPWFVAPALAGCIHVKIEQTRQVEAAVGAGESVVLVATPQTRGVNSENGFLDCLERQLGGSTASDAMAGAAAGGAGGSAPTQTSSGNGRNYKLVSHQSFVDGLYPWLEPSTVVVDSDFASTLMAHPGVKERIAASGVRYVVAINGNTDVVDKSGSITCAIGPGGGGCFGVAFWKKRSGYEANIWDLERGVSLGTVGTDVTGNSVFIGALVPLPFVVPVQHTACTRMAGELQRFLSGANP
jgi:hypothetical protein